MSLIKDPCPREVQCAAQTFPGPQLAQATDDQDTLSRRVQKKKKKKVAQVRTQPPFSALVERVKPKCVVKYVSCEGVWRLPQLKVVTFSPS